MAFRRVAFDALDLAYRMAGCALDNPDKVTAVSLFAGAVALRDLAVDVVEVDSLSDDERAVFQERTEKFSRLLKHTPTDSPFREYLRTTDC